MRRSAKFLLPFLALFSFVAIVHAQTFNFDRAYQDYLYAQSVYNQDYSAYQDARDFYLKSQTLNLKEDARQKTLTMLKSRDKMESVYLTAIRMKILESKGFGDEEKNMIFGKMDPEIKWYQDHMSSYQDGDSTDSLFSKSKEVEDRYNSTTLPIIYESLFDASLSQEIGFRKDQENIYSDVKNLINAGVDAGKLDINPFNRWFSDIDNVINTLKGDEDASRTQIQKIYGQSFSIKSSYNSATDTLSSSLASLKQFNEFLSEVVNSIKNQL